MKRCALVFVLLAMTAPALAVWPPPVRLTDGPNQNINPFLSMHERGHSVGDTVCFLVWQRSRPGGWDVYSRMVTWLDTQWLPPLLVSALPDSNLTPAASGYGSRRSCVWVNCHRDSQNIFFSRWISGSWSTPTYLTQDTFPNAEPTIWCHPDADTVWVAWASFRNGHWNLYSRYFNGTAWSQEIPIAVGTSNHRVPRLYTPPSYSTPPNILCNIWRSDTYGNSDIMLSRYQGGAWIPPVRVTTGSQEDIEPAPVRGVSARPQGVVNLLWASDSSGNFEIWGTNQDSMNTRELLTNHPGLDQEPSAVDFVPLSFNQSLSRPWLTAWSSGRDGNRNVYASYSFFTEVVDTNHGDDRRPQTASVTIFYMGRWGARFWVVWQSNRDGNWNLYGSHRGEGSLGLEGEGRGSCPVKDKETLYPTPFRPPRTITLFLSDHQADLPLKLYDLQGRVVGLRRAERKAPGHYEFYWDGRDASGKALPSGFYFLRPEGSPSLFRLILLR